MRESYISIAVISHPNLVKYQSIESSKEKSYDFFNIFMESMHLRETGNIPNHHFSKYLTLHKTN